MQASLKSLVAGCACALIAGYANAQQLAPLNSDTEKNRIDWSQLETMFGPVPAPPANAKFGGVSKTLTNEYWRSLCEGYQRYAAKAGVEVVYQAARGVPVATTKIASYVISGGLVSVAGLILVGRLGAADPTLGNLGEIDAIAAAAIGGASLMGGKGSIVGTLLGAIILGSLQNGLTSMNVQAFYQLLATGLIILVAMLIDRATRGRE